MADTDGENAAAPGAEAQSEEDRLAAEWAAMEEGEDGAAGEAQPDAAQPSAVPNRILDQNEIDNLLGFDGEKGQDSGRGIAAVLNS